MPGAIDPSQIPGAGIDPDAIETNAATIATNAAAVRDNGSLVQLKWQAMAGVYSAPESGTLLGLMVPVSSQATTAGDNLETVASALKDFAAEVRPIKAELDALRAQAQTFVDTTVRNGVQARELNPAWVSTQSSYGGYASTGFSPSTGGTVVAATDVPQYRSVHREWHEDQDSVDRNNELLGAVNAQQVLLWEAERTCANKIRALYGAEMLRAAQSADDALGYGLGEIPEGTDMPWGAPVERTEGCAEASVKFVFEDFLWNGIVVGGIWGTVQGLGTLVLGYDPATGEFFQGDAYGAAWGNLGMLGVAALANTGILAPIFQADAAARAWGGDGFLPQEVRDFKAQADETAINTGKALIAWDTWQDDPGAALGESVFNVATIVIPGGAAIAGVKTAGTAASVLGKMARFVDLVDPGAWAASGATKVGGFAFHGVGDLIGRTDFAGRFGNGVDVGSGFPEVYRGTDAARVVDELVEGRGIPVDQITVNVVDGVPVIEAPGVRVELPAGAFDAPGARVGDAAGGVDDAAGAVREPVVVREPELVGAGVRGEGGSTVVDSIVDDAPVRAETGGAGDPTVIRDGDTTTGSGGAGHGGGSDHGSGGTDTGAGGSGGPVDDATSGTTTATDGGDGAAPSYRTEDGTPYDPWTSRDQVAKSDAMEKYIADAGAKHGLTMSDLYTLIHEKRPSALTRVEARILLDIREGIPMPANGEIMQKVLDENTAGKILNGDFTPDRVGGFVARAADAQKLLSSQDLFHGLGLDYKNSTFATADGTVGDLYAMRFAKTDDLDLNIPDRTLANRAGEPGHYYPEGMKRPSRWNPFLGNGFVGRGGNSLVPEYHIAARTDAVPNGAEMWRITPDGREILVGVLRDKKWVKTFGVSGAGA